MSLLDDINKLLMPIKRSIRILASKSIITKVQVDNSGESQKLQVDVGNEQIIDEVERLQPYGLASSLKDADSTGASEAILISLAGNRDHAVIIQTDDNRFRVKVDKGDVALYNSSGMVIELKGQEIRLGKGLQTSLTPLDGVVTGQTIDSLTGVPLGSLPGGNSLGTANSQKLKVEL